MPSSEESETKRSKYVTETSPLRLKERLCAISGAAVLAIVSVGNLQLRQTQAEATAREHFR